MKNIIENNKMLSEFMGAEIVDKKTSILPVAKFKEAPANNKKYSGFELNYLEYHNSWDWLMEVVDKIETLEDNGIDVSILSEGTIIFNWRERKDIVRLTSAEIDFKKKIDHTYLAVVQFIKWYNKNTK